MSTKSTTNSTSKPSLSNPKALLARLVRLTSTIPGLDASLMIAQYSSPLVIALLLALAKFRASHPTIRFSLRGGEKALLAPAGAGLIKLAEGWGKAAVSIGDARVIMRAFGLLPILQWLLSLHPKPLSALTSILSYPPSTIINSPKTLPTLQVITLLCYYPLEHLAWLGSKGVVQMQPQSMGKAQLWSVRFWAMYVILTVYKLRQTQLSLKSRTRTLRASKAKQASQTEAEGYELQSSASVNASTTSVIDEKSSEKAAEEGNKLKSEWVGWKDAVLVNAGYAPLTMHWSTPGGLWTSPLVTSVFGTIAAYGQLTTEWRKGAA